MKFRIQLLARVSLRILAFALACMSLCFLLAQAVDRVQAQELTDRQVVGIGVALQAVGTNIVVAGILRDTPAASPSERIYLGDRILAIAQDGQPAVPVEASKLNQAIDMIRGPVGTSVSLTLVSAGEDDSHSRVVSITRAVLKPPSHSQLTNSLEH